MVIKKNRFDIIEKYMKCSKPRFLEVGCGPGYGLQEGRRRDWEVYGQDVTDVFANTIKEKLGVEIYLGELEQANFQKNFFDVVYLDSVIEHVPHPASLLKEIKRIIKPNGLIYIITPHIDAFINEFRDFVFKVLKQSKSSRLSVFSPPYHICGFSKDSFKIMCQKNRFSIKYFKIYSGKNEWRKNIKKNWNIIIRHVLYYPVYLLGEIFGKGITIEAVISTNNLEN